MDRTAETLARSGADVIEIPMRPYALFEACLRVIMAAEAFALHQDTLAARAADYSRYTYQRLAAGAVISGADLARATRVRGELAADLNGNVLRQVDALICTTSPTPAGRFDALGKDIGGWAGQRTSPFNLTGNPCLAVPTGLSGNGLPIGIQIVGRRFDEATLFRIGSVIEAQTGMAERWPAFERLH